MPDSMPHLLRQSEVDVDLSVRGVLAQKGGAVHSIEGDASVYRAIALMAEHHVGCLVVLDGDDLTGIVSERDYARKVILMGRNSNGTRVREIMTEPVITIRPDQTLRETMNLITTHRIRHLPVVDSGKVVGVLSIGDLLKWCLDAQGETIRELQSSIAGQDPPEA